MKLPVEDREFARSRGLRFYVAGKMKRGAPRLAVFQLEELEAALERAHTEQAHEIPVFLETPTGGFLYRTRSIQMYSIRLCFR